MSSNNTTPISEARLNKYLESRFALSKLSSDLQVLTSLLQTPEQFPKAEGRGAYQFSPRRNPSRKGNFQSPQSAYVSDTRVRLPRL